MSHSKGRFTEDGIITGTDVARALSDGRKRCAGQGTAPVKFNDVSNGGAADLADDQDYVDPDGAPHGMSTERFDIGYDC